MMMNYLKIEGWCCETYENMGSYTPPPVGRIAGEALMRN